MPFVLAAIRPTQYMLGSIISPAPSERHCTYIMIIITTITAIAIEEVAVLPVKPPLLQPATQVLRHLGL